MRRAFLAAVFCALLLRGLTAAAEEAPVALQPWLGPQAWQRDTPGPVISLGAAGSFDDRHLFAPCVIRERDKFWLWYCGSQGTVAQRVFRLGLASGDDGKQFQKHESNPIFEFGDGRHSVLTPAILCDAEGTPNREQGRLRLWFSATDFNDPSGRHTLRETSSLDGVQWSPPSPPLLEHAYAPTVVKEAGRYLLWYTDVSQDPWVIRHAVSRDGTVWQASETPALVPDQAWERARLFYPAVIKLEGVYLMWYGSYWSGHANQTALGFAASLDGVKWHKSSNNPVLRPDAARSWESHYTTSHSVVRLPDGSLRIWYASRKAPPFENKYFAIGTARLEAGSVPAR